MKKKRRLTATQKNIDKINSNLQSIARTFGVNSKPFEIAAQRLHGHGFELYDKNGVVQIRNNAANRAKHQTIRSIANQRQSIQVLKRKYALSNLFHTFGERNFTPCVTSTFNLVLQLLHGVQRMLQTPFKSSLYIHINKHPLISYQRQ